MAAAQETGTAAVSDREQQLLMRTVQQEEELRALRLELARRDGQGNRDLPVGGAPGLLPNRPHTARQPPRQREAVGVNQSPREENTANQLHKSFTVAVEEPARSSAIPIPTESHSAVGLDGKVYVFGGSNGPHISADTWQYTIATSKWRKLKGEGNCPSARYGHTAVAHKAVMYVFGGFGAGGVNSTQEDHEQSNEKSWTRCGLLNSLYALDMGAHEWTEITSGSHTEPVKNHSAVAYKGRMYVFGGCHLEGRTNLMRVFDFEQQKWLPSDAYNAQNAPQPGEAAPLAKSDVPCPRSGHSADVYATKHGHDSMVVFGGRAGKYSYCNDCFQFNFDSKMWNRLYCGGTVLPPRCEHSTAVYRDNLVVFGGYSMTFSDVDEEKASSTKTYFNDVFSLNLVSYTWTKIELVGPQRPLGCCGHSSVLFEAPDQTISMLIMGGWGRVRNDYRRDMEEDVMERTSTLVEGNVAYATVPEMYIIGIAQAVATKKARPPQAHRPNTARPVTSRPMSGALQQYQRAKSPPKKGRRPWSTQTSKASTAKVFSDAQTATPAPPVERRTTYQIETIIQRLGEGYTARKDMLMAQLQKKYLAERPTHNMTPEEQNESVDRLYYQQLEWRAEKRAQLQNKWVQEQSPKRIESGELDVILSRLTQVPTPPEPPTIPPHKIPKETADECIQRLHYYAKELEKRRETQLFDKYFKTKPMKKVNKEELEGIVTRLGSPRK